MVAVAFLVAASSGDFPGEASLVPGLLPIRAQLSAARQRLVGTTPNSPSRLADRNPLRANFIFENLPSNLGLLSSAVYFSSPFSPYEKTLTLALNIDRLSTNLSEARESNDIKTFSKTLLSSHLLTEDYWINSEEQSVTPKNLRDMINLAHQWSDLKTPLETLTLNTIMSFMAMWNIELCEKYFNICEPAPIFAWLQPRINPSAKIGRDEKYPKQRDRFHLPSRRLLDLVSCLRYFRRNNKWPDQIPSITDVAAWANEDERKLTRWRQGRKLTKREFDALWGNLFSFGEIYNHPHPPTALLFTSTTWDVLFIKGSIEKRNLSMFILDDEHYSRWWHNHKSEAYANGATFGSAAWTTLLC